MRLELETKGWTTLFYDVRLLGVQVDLLMRDSRGVLMLIEVKSDSAGAHVAKGQMRRLARTAAFLAQWEPIEMRLALVKGPRMRLLPVDALTAS